LAKSKDKNVIIKIWKVEITWKGVIGLLMIMAVAGVFTMLILNLGYDRKAGCYWKPADFRVDIKKTTGGISQ